MGESIATVFDLLTRPDFGLGVIAGLTVLGLSAIGNERLGRIGVSWGVLLTAACMVAIHLTVGRRAGVNLGLLGLAVGGWAHHQALGWLRAIGWIAIGIGALLIAMRGGLSQLSWTLPVTVLAIVIIGPILARWSDLRSGELVGPMLAMTAFGIWVTVPDTEAARVLLGVTLTAGMATLKPLRIRLSHQDGFIIAGLVIWIVASSGQARAASILGGWACLGLLVLIPILVGRDQELMRSRPGLTLAVHAGVVLVASRIIGLWHSPLPAAIAAACLTFGAYILMGSLGARATQDDSRSA
jgi:hypothetical protein